MMGPARGAMPEVRIQTEREVMGPGHAAKRPERAEDLWVTVYLNGKSKRQKIGPPTERNREKARELRDDWQAALDHELGLVNLPIPTFRHAGEAFLQSGLRSRAAKTIAGRRYQVATLTRYFGDAPLDRIDLGEWWDSEIEGKKDFRTGDAYLTVISLVYKHAQRSVAKLENPVPAARTRIFGDIRSTKEYQSRNESNLNPMTVEDARKLLPKLEGEPADFRIAVLLMYECGLRFGEMRAIRWRDVWLGESDADTTRHLYIRVSETDGREGATKTGRHRKVGISKRLRSVLLAWQLESGNPPPDRRVVEATWGNNFRKRLRRVCRSAKVAPYTPKDFRDTYASRLITHGIVLKWISLQLGHRKVATTENHYAAYMALEGYENPWHVAEGCLPTDLFAELDLWRPGALQHSSNILQHGKRKPLKSGG